MKSKKVRTTLYLDADISRAIRVKSAISGRSVSDFANDGLRKLLGEDARHIQIYKERRRDRLLNYDDVVLKMKRDGLL